MISYGYKLREDVREKGCARAQHDANDDGAGRYTAYESEDQNR